MAKFAIERADGGVSVMETVDDVTPDECITKWSFEDRRNIVSVTEIPPGAISTDRTFRDAWKVNDKIIDHDMTKARAIQMKRIRAARDKLLVAKDTEGLIANSKKDAAAVAKVEADKQALRDLPATYQSSIDAAATVSDLKKAWPLELDKSN